MELKVLGEKEREGEDDDGGGEEKSGAQAPGLEKPQVLRGLLYGENGNVVVDLPNRGTQHVFILIELRFHCWAYLGWRFPATSLNRVCVSRRHPRWLYIINFQKIGT